MADTTVTFFMIVTDPDILIADYAVKSYSKIKGIPFRLQVYSNWVSAAKKAFYFPVWRKLEYVEIIENEWQQDKETPTDPYLEGPYEKCTTIWDRELKKIRTPYYATVDADFEILDSKFIQVMFDYLEKNSNLAAISADYFRRCQMYDTYSGDMVYSNEGWSTYFCIYRIETLKCDISHIYHEETISGEIRRNIWDSSRFFQKKLKENGYELKALDLIFQPCFIHYGSFAKNRDLDRTNIGVYRFFRIITKRGILGLMNRYTRKLGYWGDHIFFGKVDRSHYWNGFGKRVEK